ncbi:glutamate tRNA synthetase [Actinidia rufa]|uniref:Glutamate--tRNA ligase, chloroplastic/mitochondrial n=1 Tax=Actinidia rufa TaxID=165716 RepID=A0A7J0F768_9ERIC|nr:glutamate tRNA synthetase [Actinidia rufa]
MAIVVGSPWLRIRMIPEVAAPIFRQSSSLHYYNRNHISLSFLRKSFCILASSSVDGASPVPTHRKRVDDEVRVRFAPSPTGNLHQKSLSCRANGGKFVLRIEDTDLERSTRESEQAMLHDLSWLGLDWDEGPGVGGDYGPYRQSERNVLYKQYAEKLLKSGHVYRCFCSNELFFCCFEIHMFERFHLDWDRGGSCNFLQLKIHKSLELSGAESTKQDGSGRRAGEGNPYTYRFRVPKGGSLQIDDLIRGEVSWNLNTLGDFVIMRSNGQPVYNFCVTVDDATMAISHVIRAEEHLPNTLRQALIYKALGFQMPYFAHVSLILAPDRSKLSKRHGATSVGQFREMGYLPQAMVNYLALLGWGDGTENEFFTLEQLVEKFSIDRVNKSGAVFDSTKLRWMNGQHLRSLPSEELIKLIGQHWKSTGILTNSEGQFIEEAVHLLKDGIDLIPDSDTALSNLLSYPLHATLASPEGKPVLQDGLPAVAASLLATYDNGDLLSALEGGHTGWQTWVKSFGKSMKRKGKSLFMPLRMLLTGKLHGPDMGATVLLLHRAGISNVVASQAVFVTLDDRFKMLREIKWESFNNDQTVLDSAAAAISN